MDQTPSTYTGFSKNKKFTVSSNKHSRVDREHFKYSYSRVGDGITQNLSLSLGFAFL